MKNLVWHKIHGVFGDASGSFDPVLLQQTAGPAEIQNDPTIVHVRLSLGARVLVLPRQAHGASVLAITDESGFEKALSTYCDADIVLTNQCRVGIGVVTADCLPIIIVDEVSGALAVVHAGWRGTMLNVASTALKAMEKYFDAHRENVRVWCGPCAAVDAYRVDYDFVENLRNDALKDQVLDRREDGWHYNLLKHNVQQLLHAGLLPEQIDTSAHFCTITNKRYHSYRRSGGTAQRQIAAVALWE